MNVHESQFGSGPCVVLLHAFPCDGWLWAAQAAALADAGYRALAPDLPGFGRSPLLPAPPSLDAVADALVDSLHAHGVTSAVVAGSSLGGYVAMAVARRHPQLVAGLGLVGTKATADAPEAADRRRLMARQVEEEPAGCADLLTTAVLPGLLGPTTRAQRPQLVTRCGRWIRHVPPQTVAWYQRAMADRPDSRAALAGLDVPVTVIHGVEDVLSPASEQELMSASLRHGTVVSVPRAGHLVPIEAADAVSRGLVDVADAVRGPRPA